MKVILFKLDNPGNEYEWWVKDVVIKKPHDMEQIMGVCNARSYAEIYDIDKDDDPVLVKKVKEYLSANHSWKERDIISWFFILISMALKHKENEDGREKCKVL